MSRTNEEIIEEWVANDKGRSIQECIDRMCRLCEAARSDEREKLKAEIPPVGSLPWGWMQRLNGNRVRHSDGTELQARDWKSFRAMGYSIVPDEPKPMTFAEAFRYCRGGGRVRKKGGMYADGTYVHWHDGAMSYHGTGQYEDALRIMPENVEATWYAC